MYSSPNSFAVIVLLGWVPASLALFLFLPARRAVVAGAIFAWLFLPPVSLDLPNFPGYSKATAIVLGILLGTLVFEQRRLLTFRPRWFDLPMFLWCLCPFASSISNDLGVYDALSALFRHTIDWMVPYLIGRLYLTDSDGLRELAFWMIVGGVCLIPLCLFENRMSPQLLGVVYGVSNWYGTRYGGYRPKIFFLTGLELGLWMNVVTLVAWWLWRTGQLKRLWLFSGGTIFAALLITTILCRSTGATLLLIAGMGSLWICWRTKTKWAMWCVLFVAPIYYCARIPNNWTGQNVVELLSTYLGAERAHSLEYRLVNEKAFVGKALERPAFGWGGWGRNLVRNEGGNFLGIDSLWIITFGCYGYVGLSLMTTAMLLPVLLFLVRFPVVQWSWPSFAHVTAIAVIVNLFMIDCLLNAMFNVIYIIAAGGLISITTARQPRVEKAASSGTSRDSLAARYRAAGRDAKAQGRYAEAKTAWLHALNLLTERMTAQPSLQVACQQWCACANDLAWLLVNAPDSSIHDVAHAVPLAVKATELQPECGTYWNTLGAVYYRAGDFEAAVTALNRTIAFSGGGTVFDHVFLAMAHARLGNQEQSQRWFALAVFKREQDYPGHSELTRFCNEARSIIAADPDAPVVAC